MNDTDNRRFQFASSWAAQPLLLAVVMLLTIVVQGARANDIDDASKLKAEHLPADTTWVLHIDLERLRASHVGSMLDELLAEGAAMEAELGFDPIKEIHRCTVHGTSMREENGRVVAMMYMSPVIDDLMVRLYEQYPTQWTEEDHHGVLIKHFSGGALNEFAQSEDVYFVIRPVASDHSRNALAEEIVLDERLVLIGESLPRLVESARVMDGEGTSLAQIAAPDLVVKPARGMMLYFNTTSVPDMSRKDPSSAVIQKMNHLHCEIGERDESIEATVRVSVGDEKSGQVIRHTLEQMVKFGLDTATEKWQREAIEIVDNSLQVKVRDDIMTVKLRMDIDDAHELGKTFNRLFGARARYGTQSASTRPQDAQKDTQSHKKQPEIAPASTASTEPKSKQ